VVVGSCNIDYVFRVKNLPQVGETVIAQQCHRYLGGKGANQAVAARKAGAEVSFICKLGKDREGEDYYNALLANNISKDGILIEPNVTTGTAWIAVDNQGKNQIVVLPGANQYLVPEDIASLPNEVFSGQILLIQLEIPLKTVEYCLKRARTLGMVTILNPAPTTILTPDILSLIDIITPNEKEASMLSGLKIKDIKSAQEATREIAKSGVKTVIITLGAQGVVFNHNDKEGYLPAFNVKVTDTTAAGDAFNGALASALAEGKGLAEAVLFANAAGALATTGEGAQPSLPSQEQIKEFLSRSPN
jgi:ribokinase